MDEAQIRKYILDHNIRVVNKRKSWVMQLWGALLAPIGMRAHFLDNFWTTLGKTVYVPSKRFEENTVFHISTHLVWQHEFMHVEQWEKWWILQPLTYALFPVPLFFAWFRWRWEREPYLKINICKGNASVEAIVHTLWVNYGFVWPKALMRKWFNNQLESGVCDGGEK